MHNRLFDIELHFVLRSANSRNRHRRNVCFLLFYIALLTRTAVVFAIINFASAASPTLQQQRKA